MQRRDLVTPLVGQVLAQVLEAALDRDAARLFESALPAAADALSARQVSDALGRVAEQRRRPKLPFEMAAAVPNATFPYLDYLGATSPTLGEALVNASQAYASVSTRPFSTRLEDDVRVVHGPRGEQGAPRWLREYALAHLWLRARSLTARPITLAFVRLTRSPVPGLERFFEAPISFSAPENALGFTAAATRTPMRGAAPDIATVLLESRERLAPAMVASTAVTEVERAVAAKLEHAPSLTSVARGLGLSARSLQRRLAEHDTTFADVVDSVRRARASELVERSEAPFTEVALSLGFSGPSPLTHAYRRWFGVTPTQARKRRSRR